MKISEKHQENEKKYFWKLKIFVIKKGIFTKDFQKTHITNINWQ
jgi:hypothetical protein